QMIGLVADHKVAAARDAQLDMNHGRNGTGEVLGALVDAYAAGSEPAVEPLQVGDPGADFLFRPLRAVDVVESDFQRDLQHRVPSILRLFSAFLLTPVEAESLHGVGAGLPPGRGAAPKATPKQATKAGKMTRMKGPSAMGGWQRFAAALLVGSCVG